LIKNLTLMINELNLKNIKDKNISFFNKNNKYQKNIFTIDTYKNIYLEISKILSGTNKLLDIGHGGTFDYNTKKINKIIGLDLSYMNYNKLPKNIRLVKGSVLKIPNYLNSFDKVLMNMLLHHLTGKNVSQNFENLNKSIKQSKKTLNNRGKLIIVESCVPHWFNLIEKIFYKFASVIILKFLNHPPVFQYTIDQILDVLKKRGFKKINYKIIKQGKFILQFGYKFPTFLTPVKTVIFIARLN
tara:strand:- start:921 stop:1649 length:729 start_codon:yes stop_codon:yes gene_type:complete